MAQMTFKEARPGMILFMGQGHNNSRGHIGLLFIKTKDKKTITVQSCQVDRETVYWSREQTQTKNEWDINYPGVYEAYEGVREDVMKLVFHEEF
jgi:hypothetical protein